MNKATIFKQFFFLGFIVFCLTSNVSFAQKKFDVVVYGGTAAGFTAAIQVAKMGKTVALVEPGEHIGGQMVEGLGSTDIDNHKEFQNSLAIGGLALEFYQRVAAAYGRTDAFKKMLQNREKQMALWKFESSVAERIIKNWLAEYQIAILLKSRLKEGSGNVVKEGRELK